MVGIAGRLVIKLVAIKFTFEASTDVPPTILYQQNVIIATAWADIDASSASPIDMNA